MGKTLKGGGTSSAMQHSLYNAHLPDCDDDDDDDDDKDDEGFMLSRAPEMSGGDQSVYIKS